MVFFLCLTESVSNLKDSTGMYNKSFIDWAIDKTGDVWQNTDTQGIPTTPLFDRPDASLPIVWAPSRGYLMTAMSHAMTVNLV